MIGGGVSERRRQYECAAVAAKRSIENANDLQARMRAVVDAVWTHLHPTGVSWVGFYLPAPSLTAANELVLGPSRNSPACSPIGLHGVCGQAYRGRCVRIVRDVTELGADYVACDPRDRSEIVVPILESDRCIAVLDLDSHEIGRFSEADLEGLRTVLDAVGL